MTVSLSPGQVHDAPAGRPRLPRLGGQREPWLLLMARASAGKETRQPARTWGHVSVGSPRKTRLAPWENDRPRDKRRNEGERRFRRLKGVRRLFS